MEKVLLIISVALIIIVLLQSGKANDAGQIISGGNTVLLGKTKERGAEKFITRMISNCTYILNEPAIPANSILYSKYKVYNELKQIKVNITAFIP